MGRGQGYASARPPGAEVVARRRRVRESDRCASPGCKKKPRRGGRFCEEHQAILDRVRAELEAGAAVSEYRRGRRRVAAEQPDEPETGGELDEQIT